MGDAGRSPPQDPWFVRRCLEAAWSRFADGRAADGVRDDVVRSWERSADLVPRTRRVAPLDDEDRTREQWASSPLRPAVRTLEEDLRAVARDGCFVVAVTAADGKILWAHGDRWMRGRADDVNFVPGGRWDEASMGTNALALALTDNRPSEVFSAEHFSPAVHEWVCYSAPITGGVSGAPLGVLDLSTTWDRAHPLALSTAASLARNLGLLVPPGLAAPPGEGLELRTLGTVRVTIDGRPTPVPPRQAELLAILTLNPGGLTLDGLHARLYEDLSVTMSTCKAEMSYLRRALGGRIASRPYRLDLPVTADHLRVTDRLAAGDLRGAVEAYGGPMLPESDAPAIAEHRWYLERAVRDAVLASADPDLIFALGATIAHDPAVHEAGVAALPDGDPRRALAKARLETVLR